MKIKVIIANKMIENTDVIKKTLSLFVWHD